MARFTQYLTVAYLVVQANLLIGHELIVETHPPTFAIEIPVQEPLKIEYQLSRSDGTAEEDPLYQEVCPFSEEMTLSEIAYRKITANETYFFRSRVRDQEGWSDWSKPQPFVVLNSDLYHRPSCVSEELWNELSPYFLPEDHPARPVLDQIFSESRATLSLKSLEKAGFINPKPRKWTHVVVTKHPDVPGIIFKIYLDAQRYFKQRTEYQQWIQRIEGALLINQMVQDNGWGHIFKIPKKWIYPLPENPAPPKEFIRKNFILLAEEMDILPKEENYAKWRTEWINKEKIDAIYAICEGLGLYDSAKPDNIPFCYDGRIAFVDTQTVNRWPVAYRKLTPFLTSSMQEYWKTLTKGKR